MQNCLKHLQSSLLLTKKTNTTLRKPFPPTDAHTKTKKIQPDMLDLREIRKQIGQLYNNEITHKNKEPNQTLSRFN